jgi:hypothetical protein
MTVVEDDGFECGGEIVLPGTHEGTPHVGSVSPHALWGAIHWSKQWRSLQKFMKVAFEKYMGSCRLDQSSRATLAIRQEESGSLGYDVVRL